MDDDELSAEQQGGTGSPTCDARMSISTHRSLSIPLNVPSRKLHKSNLNGWRKIRPTSSLEPSMTGISLNLLTTPTRPGLM
jgi:hypothetical protein